MSIMCSYVILSLKIRTTKYHGHHQFLPSRDVARHIHFQVYVHLPMIYNLKKKRKSDVEKNLTKLHQPSLIIIYKSYKI